MNARVWVLVVLCALPGGQAFAQCPTSDASRFISQTGVEEGTSIQDVTDVSVSINNHPFDRIEVAVTDGAPPRTIDLATVKDVGGGRKELKLRIGPRYSGADVVAIPESQHFLTVRTFQRDACQSELKVSLFGGDARVTAVVIGVNGPGLQYAEDDARTVQHFLEKSIPATDLNMVPLIGADATKRKIMIEISRAVESASSQGTLLVYFSGHGMLLEYARVIGAYFVPYDVQSETPPEFISHKELTDLMAMSSAQHKILIADSCFSGLSLVDNLKKPPDGEPWISKSLMNIQSVDLINKARKAPRDWFRVPDSVMWFSGARGTEVSYESGKLKGGVFTYYLMKAVSNPITYGNALKDIDLQMQQDNLLWQHPYIQGNSDFEGMIIPLPKRGPD